MNSEQEVWTMSRLRVLPGAAGAVVVLLATGCADGGDCAAGNPLMPVCLDATAEGVAPEPAVVFHSNRDGPIEIYTMHSDGSNVRRLTNNPGQDQTPRWSPDGSRIVFGSFRGGAPRELYIMNADGSDQRRLTSLGTSPGLPDWSPDGSRIVFHAARGDGNFDIFVMNADGTDVRRLTHTDSNLRPRWSPDGARIVFDWLQHAAGCCSRIAVMNADGTGQRILTHDGVQDQEPSWSPDGSRLVFTRFHMINGTMNGFQVVTVMNADGSGARSLGRMTMGAVNPNWSRSTGRIYYAGGAGMASQIYSVRSDGRDVRRLSASTQNELYAHVR
jgi:Tol biopolymer transport system component